MINLRSATRETLFGNSSWCPLLFDSRAWRYCVSLVRGCEWSLCALLLTTLAAIPNAYPSSNFVPEEKIWCATAQTTIFTTTDNCLDYWGGKVFPDASHAAAAHRYLRSISESGSSNHGPMVWCATPETYATTNKGKCLAQGGQAFTTYRAARAEHDRLKDPTNGLGWCARSRAVTLEKRIACLSRAGGWYVKKKSAEREVSRLNSGSSTFGASSESKKVLSIWCANASGVELTTRDSCLNRYNGKVFSNSISAMEEHGRLYILGDTSSGYNPLVWCAKKSGISYELRTDCMADNGLMYSNKVAAEAKYRYLRPASSESPSVAQVRKKNSQRALTDAAGSAYVAEWAGRIWKGQGTVLWANGDRYVGEWKDGKRHGQGTLTWSSGAKYVGEFKNGSEWKGREYDKEGNVIATYLAGVKKLVN